MGTIQFDGVCKTLPGKGRVRALEDVSLHGQ